MSCAFFFFLSSYEDDDESVNGQHSPLTARGETSNNIIFCFISAMIFGTACSIAEEGRKSVPTRCSILL